MGTEVKSDVGSAARFRAGRNGDVPADESQLPMVAQRAAIRGAHSHDPGTPQILGGGKPAASEVSTNKGGQEFFSLTELAARWRVSRSAVYVYLRGYSVLDFAPAPGRRGHKLVSANVVRQIERERMRVMR
jgi:hypothetical protein